MDITLEVIGGLLDELATETSGTSDVVREAFLKAIETLSAEELEVHAKAFEQLGAAGLASMCRVLALEELPMVH
jgi:nicotinamide mononucleotide (NMN) deamidase PncC